VWHVDCTFQPVLSRSNPIATAPVAQAVPGAIGKKLYVTRQNTRGGNGARPVWIRENITSGKHPTDNTVIAPRTLSA
jgi:hypothetical protein